MTIAIVQFLQQRKRLKFNYYIYLLQKVTLSDIGLLFSNNSLNSLQDLEYIIRKFDQNKICILAKSSNELSNINLVSRNKQYVDSRDEWHHINCLNIIRENERIKYVKTRIVTCSGLEDFGNKIKHKTASPEKANHGADLVKLVTKSILLLENIGGKVVGLANDGTITNLTIWKLLVISTNEEDFKNYFVIPYDSSRKILNCIMCPNLNKHHFELNNLLKMKVKYDVQLFNASMAAGIQNYKSYFINEFDALNKKFPAEGVKKNSEDTYQIAEGLKITLQSTFEFFNVLLNDYGFYYVPTAKINQDCLEVEPEMLVLYYIAFILLHAQTLTIGCSFYETTSKAYLKASSMTTAISGFRETGIYLMYTNIFQEHKMFLSSTATVIDLNVSDFICSHLDQKFNPKYINKSSPTD
ncbi:hypothetical protein AGLY_014175 [Aphis glycines]|uniref:Uncharacterized protein n=1 Tax=Aphis glycines TaxID=307491 RepID=A0A6G0T6H0_APHGL|nr:hypothetical protein AGLY_014175 [Aphis glycines]